MPANSYQSIRSIINRHILDVPIPQGYLRRRRICAIRPEKYTSHPSFIHPLTQKKESARASYSFLIHLRYHETRIILGNDRVFLVAPHPGYRNGIWALLNFLDQLFSQAYSFRKRFDGEGEIRLQHSKLSELPNY